MGMIFMLFFLVAWFFWLMRNSPWEELHVITLTSLTGVPTFFVMCGWVTKFLWLFLRHTFLDGPGRLLYYCANIAAMVLYLTIEVCLLMGLAFVV